MTTPAPATAILRLTTLTTHHGDSYDFVLGVGQQATLTVPRRRWRRRIYAIELLEVCSGDQVRRKNT